MDVAAQGPLALRATPHLGLVLFASSIVYGYRDVWPLMTYKLDPVDAHEGTILWTKIVLLLVGGIIVPLIMPRSHHLIKYEVRIYESSVLRGR